MSCARVRFFSWVLLAHKTTYTHKYNIRADSNEIEIFSHTFHVCLFSVCLTHACDDDNTHTQIPAATCCACVALRCLARLLEVRLCLCARELEVAVINSITTTGTHPLFLRRRRRRRRRCRPTCWGPALCGKVYIIL